MVEVRVLSFLRDWEHVIFASIQHFNGSLANAVIKVIKVERKFTDKMIVSVEYSNESIKN